MKRSFLQALGLDSEVIDKIMAEHGVTVNSLQSINESNQDTIKSLQAKLQSFEGVDIDDLRNQIETLKSDGDKRVNDLKINYAIDTALNGVKHKELLKGQFDLSKIKLDKDGNVKGIDDQLATFKEQYADFFGTEKSGFTGPTPANPEPSQPVNTDYGNLLQNADSMTADEIADMFAKI